MKFTRKNPDYQRQSGSFKNPSTYFRTLHGAEAEVIKLRAFAEAEATRARAQAESEAIKLKASANAEQISVTGSAEAGKILAIGKSTAEAYELAVKALGGENFTRYKITEELSKGHVKLIPDVLIGGNGSGNAMDGLLGLKLMEMMDPDKKKIAEVKKDDGKKEPPKGECKLNCAI